MASSGATGLGPGVIAVVGGTGAEGSGLARRWARAGYSVIIGSRDPAKARDAAREMAEQVGGEVRIEGAENREAVARADTVVLTVPFAAQLPTLKSIRDRLRPGQVLVDVTVPLATAVGGPPTRVLGVWEGSAAQQAAAAVPPDVPVVAAFHNVSAECLADLERPVECDVLVCGDHRQAKERVRLLVEAIPGCRYVDAGPLANARTVEAITALLIGINIRYKVTGVGIRITGLPED